MDIIVAAIAAATDGDKDPKTNNLVYTATTSGSTDDDRKPTTTVKIIELNVSGPDSSDDKPKPSALTDLLESLPVSLRHFLLLGLGLHLLGGIRNSSIRGSRMS